ncbi:MAG: division/cell wall cluster transcriptional repressor MraZ [Parvibaculaceae bacterium]|nr:division/cell wall cluster transcriptional repressor MraZ [Parvibaculaceae bacterium]
MLSFRGTFTNKIDAKGRVSVPAKFRAVTAAQEFGGIICFPSLTDPCIEGGGPDLDAEIDLMLSRLDPFSRERNVLANMLKAQSAELMFDADGRVSLPDMLTAKAGITDQVSFVGLGNKFQIWEPAAYEAYLAAAMAEAAGHGGLLRSPYATPDAGADGRAGQVTPDSGRR